MFPYFKYVSEVNVIDYITDVLDFLATQSTFCKIVTLCRLLVTRLHRDNEIN